MKMSCDRCSVNFTLFKRKKFCQECHRFFCSTCLPKPQSNSTVGRQCSKCRLLMSGHFSRDDLQTWKINDIKCFLNVRNISTKDCREKHDLIELVVAHFCTHQPHTLQDQVEHETLVQQMAAHVRGVSFINVSSSAGTSLENSPQPQRNSQAGPLPRVHSETSIPAAANQSSQTNSVFENSPAGSSNVHLNHSATNQGVPQEIQVEINSERLRELLESMERIQAIINEHDQREQNVPSEQPVRRTQLSDITDIAQIDDLSIRQLKELLVNNFVDYKGCCEKAELVIKTKLLWTDHQENIIRARRIHKQEEEAGYGHQDSKDSVVHKTSQEESTSATASTAKTEEDKEDTAPSNHTPEKTADTSVNTPKPVQESAGTMGDGSKQNNDSLCSICMDSLVDCILLECGHMVTCIQCGKRLSSCPVCRQYIVRVVRVFRS